MLREASPRGVTDSGGRIVILQAGTSLVFSRTVAVTKNRKKTDRPGRARKFFIIWK